MTGSVDNDPILEAYHLWIDNGWEDNADGLAAALLTKLRRSWSDVERCLTHEEPEPGERMLKPRGELMNREGRGGMPGWGGRRS
jgi:hypothetical protein